MSLHRRDGLKSITSLRQSLPAELYITDHPDDPREPREHLRDLYGKLPALGFTSVRYDWRWSIIEPRQQIITTSQVAHYRQVKEAMDIAGLDAPTIILSSPPAWALSLYKAGDRAAFLAAYKRYAELVAAALHEAGGESIRTVQVLNELNNRLYTRIKSKDIAVLCSITREAFRPYFGEVQLLATVLVLPARPPVSSVLPFLRRHRETLESCFDVIGVDYYPGVWHWPSLRDTAVSLKTWQGLRAAAVGNTHLLEAVYRELATWQLGYELAEVGWTSYRLFGGEAAQEVCFAIFLQAYSRMLVRLSDEGCILPRRMGLYAARDESNTGVLRYVARWQRWGLYDDTLQAKAIVNRLSV